MTVRWVALICLLAAVSSPALGQSLLLSQDDINYFGIEGLKPDFSEGANVSFLTFAAYASFRYKVNPALAVVAEIPFSHYDPDTYGDAESMLGDIYLGFEGRAGREGVAMEFGVRLPTATEDKFSALVVGVYSDVNRWEAFLPKVVSFIPAINYRDLNQNDVGFRIRVAPSVDIPTEGGGDAELYGLYAAQFIYMGREAEVTAGFSGRVLVTESDLDFGQRSLHQFDAAVSLTSSNVHPGFHVRLPLDKDLTDFLDVVFGFQVAAIVE